MNKGKNLLGLYIFLSVVVVSISTISTALVICSPDGTTGLSLIFLIFFVYITAIIVFAVVITFKNKE